MGAALGAAVAAAHAARSDLGVPDDTARRIAASLPPGTAAPVLLARNLRPEQVARALDDAGGVRWDADSPDTTADHLHCRPVTATAPAP